MTDIDLRLTRCFSAVLPEIPAGRVQDASVETVAGWDSVALVNLLNVVSEEFGIEIDWGQTEDLTSYAAIRRMIAAHSTS